MLRPLTLLIATMLGIAACAGSRAAPAAAPAPAPDARPLGALSAQHVIVVPAQRFSNASGIAMQGSARDLLDALDGEIATALGERGMRGMWAFAGDVARSAQRSPTLAPDPRTLAVNELTLDRRKAGALLTEPLASQLRALGALHDARYALVPVELRIQPLGAGSARGVLRAALVDARQSQVRWAGDVAGDSSAVLGPALAASVARHLADLVAAP
jgi:hypothetical protein